MQLSFKRRTYSGKRSGGTGTFRCVATYNGEDDKYHLYLTNINTAVLDTADIASLYRTRWEIELIFKELKSKYALHAFNTRNPDIVEAMIWCALLTLFVSRRLFNLWRNLNPGWGLRFTSFRWAKAFNRLSMIFMQIVLQSHDIELTPELVMDITSFELPDTHVRRERMGEGWWA